MKSHLKKIISGIVAIVTSFSLVSCSSNQIDEEKTATDMKEILTQLFDSIKNGDKEVFKTYFADEALNVSDFEDGWEFLCDQYKGDLLSIDCKFPMGEGTRFVPGERIHYAFTTFNIITNENEYVAYIDFYTQYSSKYPEGSYRIRMFKLLTKQMLDDGENFHDCSLRHGIYYPGWLGVENIEGNESKLYDRLSVIYSEYDRVEIVTYFYVRDAEDHIDTFCLIDTGDRLDLRSVITYNGGLSFDFILLVEDMQIPYDYSVTSTVGDREISFYVSDKQLNSSEYKEVIEFSHGNLNYWFGIKSIDCFD